MMKATFDASKLGKQAKEALAWLIENEFNPLMNKYTEPAAEEWLKYSFRPYVRIAVRCAAQDLPADAIKARMFGTYQAMTARERSLGELRPGEDELHLEMISQAAAAAASAWAHAAAEADARDAAEERAKVVAEERAKAARLASIASRAIRVA